LLRTRKPATLGIGFLDSLLIAEDRFLQPVGQASRTEPLTASASTHRDTLPRSEKLTSTDEIPAAM
jgi:hypothetical protein